MIKIALLSPWPPQASGIADYAYGLGSYLAGICTELHVFTSEPNPRPLRSVEFHHVDDAMQLSASLAAFEYILVQLGNHPNFHGYMLPFLEQQRHRCVVELHDFVLHHLLKGENEFSPENVAHLSWIEKHYGIVALESLKNFLQTNRDLLAYPGLMEYPCSDVITKGARAVIVHSNFIATRLIQRGVANLHVLDLAWDDAATKQIPESNADCLRFGVFGGVQTNRRVDWIVEAFAQVVCSTNAEWQLEIVGDVDFDCEYLRETVISRGLTERIHFLGRLPSQEFEYRLQSCDVVIALRNPTMGESSAIVTQALKLGVPCVVSDTGSYSELPSCVLKIQNRNGAEELTTILLRMLHDKRYVETLRKEVIHYADRWNISVIADDILQVVLKPMLVGGVSKR